MISARATWSRQTLASSAMRLGPMASKRAASPKPMIPWPFLIKAVGFSGKCRVMSKPAGVANSRVSTRSFLSDDIQSRFIFRAKIGGLTRF